MRGEIQADRVARIEVDIHASDREIAAGLRVTNLHSRALHDVWLNICASVNHLPGAPGWCNRAFMPDAPLDRAAQGRYWYEQASPRGLSALTSDGWVPMHPCPERPQPDPREPYASTTSELAEATACAAQAPGKALCFFQAWDAPCRWVTPFSRNACMHLEPFVAERLRPGESAHIRGRIGIHHGERAALMQRLRMGAGA